MLFCVRFRRVEPIHDTDHCLKPSQQLSMLIRNENAHQEDYGLHVTHSFISAYLANQTKFSKYDLKLLWHALCGRSSVDEPLRESMFEHAHIAACGLI